MHQFLRLASITTLLSCCFIPGCMKYGAPIMNDQKDVFLLPYTKSFIGMPTKSGLLLCVPRVDGVKCVEGPQIVPQLPCNARDQAILNLCNTQQCNQAAATNSVPAVVEKQELSLKAWTAPAKTDIQVPVPVKTDSQVPPPVKTEIEIPAPAKEAGNTPSADCTRVCDRFVMTIAYSNIRKINKRSCLQRCGAGDKAFSACAWEVMNAEDIQACLKMPAAY